MILPRQQFLALKVPSYFLIKRAQDFRCAKLVCRKPMRITPLHLLVLAAMAPVVLAQTCFNIHGRAVDYRGDAFFELWHVGTHHIYFPADQKSVDLICQYFDCGSPDRQPALFADFTICPAEPFKQGAAQPVFVKNIQHPFVVAEWPPSKSPREFVEQFYAWYVPRAQSEDSTQGWNNSLKLMRWDLSAQLAKLLEEGAAARARCKEAVGLDFDPFLRTNEPSDHYEVGNIDRIGDHYRAKIHRIVSGKRKDVPDVIAEFVRKEGRWFFLDFYNPLDGTSLVSILKAPRPKCRVPREPATR